MRSLIDHVNVTDPQDVPLQNYLGRANQKKFRIRDFPNHKYAWLLDHLKTRSATLAEAMDTTEQGMDVVTGQGIRFKSGDVWRSVETGELVWVDSRSTDTITVIRNWGAAMGGAQGTATVGMTTATALEYLFSARLEGDTSDPAHWTTPSEEYNYTQIMHHEIEVTGSEQDASTRYGVTDYYRYQFMKAMGGLGAGNGKKGSAGDLLIDLEKTWFHGQRIIRADGVAGAMGGFKEFVVTNAVDLNSAYLDEDILNDAIQSCWTQGGKPNLIVCNAFNKRLISSWYAGSVRTERTATIGGVVVSQIETEFGLLDLMLNRWCPTTEVDIVQSADCGWITARDWREEKLAKTGDSQKTQLIGEFGLVILNENCHAVITETRDSN
jgi:hypothetical protein